jgi:hypothetical protein
MIGRKGTMGLFKRQHPFYLMLAFCFLTPLQARPPHLEVWFLSEYSVSSIPAWSFGPQVALNESALGINQISYQHESHMGECQGGGLFDWFCGEKNRAETKTTTALEIWIDISSSFLQVDPLDSSHSCYRGQFLQKILSQCPQQNVLVRTFDTNLQEISGEQNSCQAKGLNNVKKTIQWIEESQVENVIIITDISEFQTEFADYLISQMATLRGVDLKDKLLAKDLLASSLTNVASQFCQFKNPQR